MVAPTATAPRPADPSLRRPEPQRQDGPGRHRERNPSAPLRLRANQFFFLLRQKEGSVHAKARTRGEERMVCRGVVVETFMETQMSYEIQDLSMVYAKEENPNMGHSSVQILHRAGEMSSLQDK